MNKRTLIYIIGKSCSGKDTLYNKLINSNELDISPVVMHTSRPMRDGEVDKVTYNFISEDDFIVMAMSNEFVEHRCYNVANGDVWRYGTSRKSLNMEGKYLYASIGTIESYLEIEKNIGEDIKLVPIYLKISDYYLLNRALNRLQNQNHNYYLELCRRFIADSKDFSEEKLSCIKNLNVVDSANDCYDTVIDIIKANI